LAFEGDTAFDKPAVPSVPVGFESDDETMIPQQAVELV